MASELKPSPCPLCGKTDNLKLDTLGDLDDWFIECDRCHIGTHAIFRGREATLAAWNTRPVEDALVEALKDFVMITEGSGAVKLAAIAALKQAARE